MYSSIQSLNSFKVGTISEGIIMSAEKLSPDAVIRLFMYDTDSSQIEWQYQFDCSIACFPWTSNTYVSRESKTLVVATHHDYKPTIFEVSLTNGTLQSTILYSTKALTTSSKPTLTQFGGDKNHVIISYPYNSGTSMIIWSTTTSSVIYSHEIIFRSTVISAIVGLQSNGMMYFASGNPDFNIYKFYYYDPSKTSSIFSGSIDMTTFTSYNYATTDDIGLTAEPDPSRSNVSLSPSDITPIQNSNTTSDIVYTNGRDQFHSFSSGYNGNLSFDYFCSKSGASSLTVSIYNVENNSVSSWISVDSDYTFLTVDAPTVTTDTNYSYGISYLLGDYNITSENIIRIYPCSVSNCTSCEYSTKDTTCTTCDTGYTLSSDNSSCTQDQTVEEPSDDTVVKYEQTETLATTTKATVGATMVVGAVSSMSGASSASSGPSVWALINQYQLILLLPMLGTYLENNFEFYITEFELMSFDFDFMDFIEFPFIDPKVDVIDYQQPNELFRNNGVESGSFIHNHYRFIKVILIVFICDMIFILTKLIIFKLIKPKHQCWTKIFDKGSGFFRFGVYLRSLIEASLFI